MDADPHPRLRQLVEGFDALLAREGEETAILDEGTRLLQALIAEDDWLPEAYAQPSPERYTQYRLHLDPAGRFSVVSFVWGPGQGTPVHDHTVWGLVGVMRGAELSQPYTLGETGLAEVGPAHRLEAGEVEAVSPRIGDIHKVSNAFADQPSVSIHVYGADIGAVQRSTYGPDGGRKPFVSGYANAGAATWA